MRARKGGMWVALLGGIVVFTGSWLVMWWLAPIWSNSPPEQFAGTSLAVFGPVFMTIALSVPLGLVLLILGTVHYTSPSRPGRSGYLLFVIGSLALGLSMLLFPTMGYLPWLFGIFGGLILCCFFAAIALWARNRLRLTGAAAIAADFELASYVFFLLAAILACSLLGNPFSGLLFPEKVIDQDALPYHYSMATKMAVFMVLGMLAVFLRQHFSRRNALN